MVLLTTHGDRRDEPLAQVGGEGLFTKEIQRALLEREIDVAVHSLKDLPTVQPEALFLTAVPQRAPVGDVFVSSKHPTLDALPRGATVGSGSPRRRAQLLYHRPDLLMKDIRGNIDTRLKKLESGEYDAIILAEAGLMRLGLTDKISERIPLSLMLPAVGQGALGVETRKDDDAQPIVARLDHMPSHAAVMAEREMLSVLQSGCLAPVAALGEVKNDQIHLTARVFSPDGRAMIEVTQSSIPYSPEFLGRIVAETLLAQGAADLIRSAH